MNKQEHNEIAMEDSTLQTRKVKLNLFINEIIYTSSGKILCVCVCVCVCVFFFLTHKWTIEM